MLTIENLESLGANTAEGLQRCLNKEDFYLRMVTLALKDDGYEKLIAAVEAGDLDEGFERAHALKGVLSNVALTSLAAPVIEITEDLRARKDMDYAPYLAQISELVGKYRALLED